MLEKGKQCLRKDPFEDLLRLVEEYGRSLFEEDKM